MKKIFEEYGGVIVALITTTTLAAGGETGGWIGNAFKNVVTQSVNKATEGIETGSNNNGNTAAEPIILERGAIIPEGGTYYVGVTSKYIESEDKNLCLIGDYEGATAVYTAGEKMPETLNSGDIFVYGDYEYRYEMDYYHDNYNDWRWNSTVNGWGAAVLDRTKTEYGQLCTTINGENLYTLTDTYESCTNMTIAPSIPTTVARLSETFRECSSLTDVSNLVIHEGVESMYSTFVYCTSLTTVPTVSNTVINMYQTFYGCSELTGEIEINANPSSIKNCFGGNTSKPIKIVGACSLETKQALAETARNGNVTY